MKKKYNASHSVLRTIGAEHQHHMCGVTTHQLKMRRKSRYGYYKEFYQALIANQHEKYLSVNTNKT